MRKRGFSLVELMMVVLIIGIILAIAVPNFTLAARRNREEVLRNNLRVYRQAVNLFLTDTGVFPASLSALTATTAPATGLNTAGGSVAITATSFRGPYVATIENDPISRSALTYTTTSPNVGRITSSATGNDSQGNPYSGY